MHKIHRFDFPSEINLSDAMAEREARLLTCGEYPAKDLTVTEADLDEIVAHFSEPVPVKVEHQDTPLDPLGQVAKIWRDGRDLMGRIVFPKDMASFLARRGKQKLSVGLLKAPSWRLLEASLTLNPHVPTATLLSDSEQAELVRLRAETARQRVEAQVTAFKAQGRLLPASESLARALLASEEAVVTLSGGTNASASVVFADFLASLPPLARFGEVAMGGPVRLFGGASGAAGMEGDSEFTDEEIEVLKRLGVSPADVRRMRKTTP